MNFKVDILEAEGVYFVLKGESDPLIIISNPRKIFLQTKGQNRFLSDREFFGCNPELRIAINNEIRCNEDKCNLSICFCLGYVADISFIFGVNESDYKVWKTFSCFLCPYHPNRRKRFLTVDEMKELLEKEEILFSNFSYRANDKKIKIETLSPFLWRPIPPPAKNDRMCYRKCYEEVDVFASIADDVSVSENKIISSQKLSGTSGQRENSFPSFLKLKKKKTAETVKYVLWTSEGIIYLNVSSDYEAWNLFCEERSIKPDEFLQLFKIFSDGSREKITAL